MNTKTLLILSLMIGLVFSCQKEDFNDSKSAKDDAQIDFRSGGIDLTPESLEALNVQLASSGSDVRILMAEYITNGSGEEAGATIIAKDVGNKQLSADFVPNDPRRAAWSGAVGGSNDNITYAIDQTGDAVPPFGGLTGAETDAAIERAMSTWQDVLCSDLDLTRNPTGGADLGYIAALNGLGGSFIIGGDVQHSGWRDIDFGGGVLGVAFTLIFTDGGGAPTDIDNNGKTDVAFRDLYYDPSWNWADDGSANIDVESVAVHEAGHGLSQAHFGNIKIKNDGSLQASPRAIMNALYSGPYRNLAGTDNGGHCSNWGEWPNN